MRAENWRVSWFMRVAAMGGTARQVVSVSAQCYRSAEAIGRLTGSVKSRNRWHKHASDFSYSTVSMACTVLRRDLSSFRFPIDAARERVLGRILPQVETACDLACGTGTTALILARKGIKMYALDLSPLMCRLAREKAGRARLPVRVFRADMRHFRLPQSVDLVTCEYDALNHVPRRADLRFVAKAVQR